MVTFGRAGLDVVRQYGAVPRPREIEVPARSLARLGRVVGPARSEAMLRAAATVHHALGGKTFWNVSSTEHGGGVAEMLDLLVGYALDAGVDARWLVMEADPEFFSITKRLHNRLHGVPGDSGALGPREAAHYAAVTKANAAGIDGRFRPGDMVVLHDPQTAGLAAPLRAAGARVIWRCHIGADRANSYTEEAWHFLAPHLAACHTFVFSHAAFVPPLLAGGDVWIIEPSIDPLSPKNRPLPPARVASVLGRIGLVGAVPTGGDSAVLGGAGPVPPDAPLVVQVSRWDRLKDMDGVLRGFAEHVAGHAGARLALIGPDVSAVTDDPEGAADLAECRQTWESLPTRARNAVRLVALPMEDPVANALMVNAAQRHARIVVQKSLQEGFGLTVAEAMWKSRPVVASAVGGVTGQVAPGTGILLQDPRDLSAFGRAVRELLDHPEEAATMGRRAHRRVRAHYLSDRHLLQWARLLEHVSAHHGAE
jgi:trehalose synthase